MKKPTLTNQIVSSEQPSSHDEQIASTSYDSNIYETISNDDDSYHVLSYTSPVNKTKFDWKNDFFILNTLY